eukprot:scaffold232453_cov31-Tisochrysis_lutea.AAC.3
MRPQRIPWQPQGKALVIALGRSAMNRFTAHRPPADYKHGKPGNIRLTDTPGDVFSGCPDEFQVPAA